MSVLIVMDLCLHMMPPQNLEAEQSVLGGILLDNHASMPS